MEHKDRMLELYWCLSNVAEASQADDLERDMASMAILELQDFNAMVADSPNMPMWMIASSIIGYYAGERHGGTRDPTLVYVYTATLPQPDIIKLDTHADVPNGLAIDLTVLPGYQHGDITAVDGIDKAYLGTVPWLVVMDISDVGGRSKVVIRKDRGYAISPIYH